MIPDVPRGALLDAMQNFDKELRTTKEWANWEQNHAHKYAIVHDGRQYPVKQIIHMATGADNNSFSGGDRSDNGMCWAHDPANAEKRRKVASRAGKTKPGGELAVVKRQLREIADDVIS